MAAAAVGAVKSLSSITPDESDHLLGFDSAMLMLQARLPVLLAALALLRDTFGDSTTKCYPPDEVTNTEAVLYLNAYCTYRENDNLIGYHEFVPFSFTLQAVLIQIPAFAWIACGGRKISMVAVWFAKCCRQICSEAESPTKVSNDVVTNEGTNWPKVHSIMQCYIDEWSVSRTYVLTYFFFRLLVYCACCASLTYHILLVKETIYPDFLNHEYNCTVEHEDFTIICVKPYEIFNQILIIIDLVLCIGIPLVMMFTRDIYLIITFGQHRDITQFIPFLTAPRKTILFNNTRILMLYYKEIIGLDEKYVQKILVPWKSSQLQPNEYTTNATTEKTCL